MTGRGAQERCSELQERIRGGQIKESARFKEKPGSWTRERDMPLRDILLCTLGKKALTAAMEVRQYFQAAEKAEQAVSKQDYLRQRQNLNPEVFRLLNREYLRHFYSGEEAAGWHGYVVLAADGSRAEIPNCQGNRDAYGESENQYGKGVARANISVLYDVYNRFIIDLGIHHFRDSEIAEGKEHIGRMREAVGERPVRIIFDRNYVSLDFLNYLEGAGVKYLIRLHKGDYKAEVERMTGEDEEVGILHTKNRLRLLRAAEPERAAELDRAGETRARVIKGRFGGEEGALITNLGKEIGGEEIREQYRERWEIEEKYHRLKNKMKFESVTGKASVYVAQDFLAQVLVFNMVQDLIGEAEEKARELGKERGYRYEVRINENIAIGLWKEQFVRLMLEDDDEKKDRMFRRLKEDMVRNIVPVRQLKGKPRKWNYFNKYKCNQKPSF
jgi:hypothetical protein